MIKIALLSRGPSYNKTWRPELRAQYLETIGLNDVPANTLVDWWVFRDEISFSKWSLSIVGSMPKIFTSPHILENLVVKRLWSAAESFATIRKSSRVVFDYELDIPSAFPDGPNPCKWSTWSGSAALGFAYCRAMEYRRINGPEPIEIDCYGVDLGGIDDAFGNVETSRNAARWTNERNTWDAMVEIIEGLSISVHRIPANG